jgi:protein-tyrosine phosphatase
MIVEDSYRHLALPGTYNVRDLGWYPAEGSLRTRSRILFRGDSLHRLDAQGVTQLTALPLRSIIDLRGAPERSQYPTRLGRLDVTVHVIPLVAEREGGEQPLAAEWTLLDSYQATIRTRGAEFVAIARTLAVPGALPCLFHCMAGKDRTGLVAAILLSALGVPDDIVAADFAQSSRFLGAVYHREATKRTLARGVPADMVERVLTTEPSYIRAILDELRGEYGDTSHYLYANGLEEDELSDLRNVLLEPDLEAS